MVNQGVSGDQRASQSWPTTTPPPMAAAMENAMPENFPTNRMRSLSGELNARRPLRPAVAPSRGLLSASGPPCGGLSPSW